jgi:transposase
MITLQQYGRLQREYARSQNMTVSALKAGVDRRTARKYLNAQQPPAELGQPHDWRTRPDPLAAAWPAAMALLEGAPDLEAKTVFEFLSERPENGLEPRHLRTFQRRVRHWRATRGPAKEVMFPQRREPGDLLELDWTHAGELEVTVEGRPLEHLFCHGTLAYSNWEWAVRCQSESYLSLVGGLQACFQRLGGVPRYVLTDNSSAATHEIVGGKRAYNPDYLDVCEHYGFEPITIAVGCPNEQGDIESANRHLKRRLEQYLLLRGHRDFPTTEAYDGFVVDVLSRANRPRQARLAEEVARLRPLPPTRLAEYRELRARVGTGSTMRVKNVTYSVPSRLVGQTVRVERYESELKVYLGRELVVRLPRQSGDRGARIDFRHVVGALLRKPGAFRNYQHREALYPAPVYRVAYDALVAAHGERGGVIEYLQVLKLAADLGVETVAVRLESRMAEAGKWRAAELAGGPGREAPPELSPLLPELASYDRLLESEVADVR